MMCKNSCGFYANPDNEGFCSQCFKKTYQVEQKIKEISDKQHGVKEHQDKEFFQEEFCSYESTRETIKDDNLCIVCNKKIKLSTIQCRCKQPLCKNHVTETSHECIFDYKKFGRELLCIKNPKIAPNKHEKI